MGLRIRVIEGPEEATAEAKKLMRKKTCLAPQSQRYQILAGPPPGIAPAPHSVAVASMRGWLAQWRAGVDALRKKRVVAGHRFDTEPR